MRAPEFWQAGKGGIKALLLTPISWIYAFFGSMNLIMFRPQRVAVPVICVGNLVAGGAGKTPVALNLGTLLLGHGKSVHYVSRGYGGTMAGPHRVDRDNDTAAVVGDEPLLLAAIATTWVARDRAKGCRAAVEAGAEIIILDDGFQSPDVYKDISIVVVDGVAGFGNGRIIPAGPLRESVVFGLIRADAVVIVGPDQAGVSSYVTATPGPRLPILRGNLQPGPEAASLANAPVVAFAGIGRPEKFFQTLYENDCDILDTFAFDDHHAYSNDDIDTVLSRAQALNARPVTTAKDATRIPTDKLADISVLTVSFVWDEDSPVRPLLDAVIKPERIERPEPQEPTPS